MSLFISYSHKDAEFVDKLALRLIENNIKVWKDKWKTTTGDSFVKEIQAGIEGASFFCIVLSVNSLESEWVTEELRLAVAEESKGGEIAILPILIDDCEIPTSLKDRLYADFRHDFDFGLKQIIQVVGRHYNVVDYGRIEPDETDTPYYFDYGFEEKVIDGKYSLQVDIVSFDLEENHSVLTQFFISATEYGTREHLGLSDEESLRDLILSTCNSEFSSRPARISLKAKAPEKAHFTILDADGEICFHVNSRIRWLGVSSGSTMVFNVGALFGFMCKDLGILE
jgi:hypothetical protein